MSNGQRCASYVAVLALGMLIGRTDFFALLKGQLLSDSTPCDSSGLKPIPPLLHRSWVYDELSPEETSFVANYAVRRLGINSTMAGGASTGNALSGTESVSLIPPDKLRARAFVDGATDLPPARYARIVVVRGLESPPDVMEYRVGPLLGCNHGHCSQPAIDDQSVITPLVEPGAIPYAKRPYDLGDDTVMQKSLEAVTELLPMFTAVFGRIWDIVPDCHDCFNAAEGRSLLVPYNDISSTAASRISLIRFNWYLSGEQVQAQWLHELPISFRLNQTGSHADTWHTYDFSYCNHLPTFPTAAALLEAWKQKKIPDCFDKSTIDPKLNGHTGAWDVPGLPEGADARPGSTLEPPEQTCSRRRFQLGADADGNNGRLVSWLGWTFFATVRPQTGLAVMDVRFKGERIAHELALSEAVALYSGSGGDQVMYLDSAYSMAQLSGALIPGVDCPTDAAYLNGTMWTYQQDAQGLRSRKSAADAAKVLRSDPTKATPFKAACVFERDQTSALWRHTEVQAPNKQANGVRATSLVVRMVSTVSNYDYLTEIEFVADGSVKVSLIFAGYCEIRWYSNQVNPWEKSLGEIAHHSVAAPLHSHFGTFKVDLDVLGENNSFEKTLFKVGRPDGVPGLENYPTKYVQREVVDVEGIGESTAVADGTLWRIVNRNPSTKLGEAAAPGYSIVPHSSTHQILPSDHPMVRSTPFTKYNLAVTRRHESEQRVSSVYDLFGQFSAPYLNFDEYLNDSEPIDGQDLVAWVTVGKEHLPRTEDVPLVTNFGISFSLLPWNVFDVNGAAMDMPLMKDL